MFNEKKWQDGKFPMITLKKDIELTGSKCRPQGLSEPTIRSQAVWGWDLMILAPPVDLFPIVLVADVFYVLIFVPFFPSFRKKHGCLDAITSINGNTVYENNVK